MTPLEIVSRASRVITFLPHGDLSAAIENAADAELLSPAEYLDRLLAGHLAEHGRLPRTKEIIQ